MCPLFSCVFPVERMWARVPDLQGSSCFLVSVAFGSKQKTCKKSGVTEWAGRDGTDAAPAPRTMCGRPVILRKCLFWRNQQTVETEEFHCVCVCCFCPGADSVVTPLSFQGAGAAWEKPSRTQQTGLTHSHIIRLCTATRPTDHRDQESARSGNTGAGLVSLLV